MEKLYTLSEASKLSGYNDQHLRKLCREKKVAHTIRGSRYMFTAEELEGLARHIAVAVQVSEIEKAELKKAQAEVRAAGLLRGKGRWGYKKNNGAGAEETGE
jgi:hypothetical protein